MEDGIKVLFEYIYIYIYIYERKQKYLLNVHEKDIRSTSSMYMEYRTEESFLWFWKKMEVLSICIQGREWKYFQYVHKGENVSTSSTSLKKRMQYLLEVSDGHEGLVLLDLHLVHGHLLDAVHLRPRRVGDAL